MRAYVLAVAAVLAAIPTAPEDTAVQIETTGGEVHEGTIKLSKLEMETDFGAAVIDIEKLVDVVFGEPDVVTTTSGVVLRGEVELKRLNVSTADGRVGLRRENLARLAVTANVPRLGGPWDGRWMSAFGPMELLQEGNSVAGTYGWDGDSTIEGEVDGDELRFEWRGPNGRGGGSLELWEDGSAFTGEYSVRGGNSGLDWVAYRLAPRAAEIAPGEVTQGQTESGLNYHLRAPAGWDGTSPLPAIAFLHGSNMSSESYVHTIASEWPALADDFLLVGLDGEQLGSGATPEKRTSNFTYINFSGHEIGQRWRYRQSPALVAEALQELGAQLPVTRWFVGGHSQGGFLTYAIALFYPELVAGAFPMSCNLLVQCEPDYAYFQERPEHAARAREVAFAHVHGTTDPQVGFSSATYCYERLQDGGFPMARLFADDSAGHMFAFLPVEEAVRWLEAVTSEDPAVLLAFAERRLDEEDGVQDAVAALDRAEARGADAGAVAALRARIRAEVEPAAAALAEAIAADADGGWVDGFWEFRRVYGGAPEGAPVLEAYAALRAEHAGPADELFYEARGEEDEAKRDALRRRIVEEYYASKWYPLVKRWLEE